MKGNRTYLILAVAAVYLLGIKLGFWQRDIELLSGLAGAAVLFLRMAIPRPPASNQPQPLVEGRDFDLWPAEKSIKPEPQPTSPRNYVGLIAAFCFSAALLLPTGCQTADTQQHDRLARIANTAANLGTTLYLQRYPDQRPAFEAAVVALTVLIDRENYDPAEFAAALQGLPIDELKGSNGSLYVSTALVIWDELAAHATGLDRDQLVKKTLLSVRDGMRAALTRKS